MTNNDIYQSVTDRIVKALEKGVVPWRKPWSSGGTAVPRNAVSGKPYRGGNVWLLLAEAMFRGFQEQRWLTFKQAMSLGGTFKGEKGDEIRKATQVILWKPMMKELTDANGNAVIKNGKPVMKRFYLLRTFNVFNVEQFDGLKLKPIPTQNPVLDNDSALSIWENYKDKPETTFGYDHACYYPSSDRMQMPHKHQFESADAYYSTLFHEAGHSTGHKTRLDRETINTFAHFGDQMYSEEELVAEFCAAFLCAQAGIDNTLDNSASYLAHWIEKLKGDPKLLLTAATRAQRAADWILGITFNKDGE